MAGTLIITTRKDKTWGWVLFGDNGSDIIATDGNQGYENKSEAEAMGKKVISGFYKDAKVLFDVPRR